MNRCGKVKQNPFRLLTSRSQAGLGTDNRTGPPGPLPYGITNSLWPGVTLDRGQAYEASGCAP